MKIILTTDVPKLGHPNSILTVKNGYARNYLIPNGLAVPFSEGIAKEIEKFNAKREKQRTEIMDNAAHYAKEIAKIKLHFSAKASPKGILYGSISPAMIIDQLAEDHKISLSESDILIDGNGFKETGHHQVTIKLGSETADLKIDITAEK